MSDPSNRQIVIFATTLRDGEQSPGASMNLAEKMEVAQALVELGVRLLSRRKHLPMVTLTRPTRDSSSEPCKDPAPVTRQRP